MTVDDLEAYGLRRMDEPAIERFLTNQRVGVLGLSDEPVPYLLPLSFGYDGGDRLYFTYVGGAGSQKHDLTQRATQASFLVFQVDTMYNWQSVSLTGSLSSVPESEWDELESVLAGAWRPEVFAAAAGSEAVAVYAFEIEERSGLKHVGLPPGFEGTDQ